MIEEHAGMVAGRLPDMAQDGARMYVGVAAGQLPNSCENEACAAAAAVAVEAVEAEVINVEIVEVDSRGCLWAEAAIPPSSSDSDTPPPLLPPTPTHVSAPITGELTPPHNS